jgi:TonB family protein
MPETRLKPEAYQPENDSNNDRDQQIAALLMRTVERIRSAMSASGVVITVCDPDGACCLASTGEAPAVGSRLQPDSAFTRECFETGEVVLCEDTENDSRILPSVAKSLRLRSAVAVPIKAQGSVVGVIEVFSSRPSDIYPTDVDALKDFANWFAPIIVPEAVPSAPPASDGSAPSSRTGLPLSAEVRDEGPPSFSTNCLSREPRLRRLDPPRLVVERGSAGSATLPSNPRRSPADSTAEEISRGRAASLSFLVVLFFFLFVFLFGAFRSLTTRTSARSSAPPPSGSAKRDASGPREVAAQRTVRPQGPNRSDLIMLPPVSISSSSAQDEKPGIASDASFQSAHEPAVVSRDLKLPVILGNEGDSGRLSSPAASAETTSTAASTSLGGQIEPDRPAALPGGTMLASSAPVGGQVEPAQLISSIAPTYPALARSQNVLGDVVIDALIDLTGKVTETKVVSGPMLLRESAMETVRMWRYSPARLDGLPVPMHLQVTVKYVKR